MLYYYISNEKSSLYFEQLSLNLVGSIDLITFTTAWQKTVDANSALRTAFKWASIKQPVQIVLKENNAKIEIIDLGSEISLKKVKEDDLNQPFNLEKVPFRVTLCNLGSDNYEMIVSFHHIILDGWSLGIVLKEFFEVYNSLIENKPLNITSKANYKDFIKIIQKQDKNNQIKYWQKYLSEIEFGTNISPAQIKVDQISKTNFVDISIPLTEQLRIISNKYSITQASILYSAWAVLLNIFTNSQDVVFGTTVSGRNVELKDINSCVGLFINTIPLYFKIDNKEKISNLLIRANQIINDRNGFEHTPLVDILGSINNRNLFDTIVVVENYPLDEVAFKSMNNLKINGVEINESTNYPLTLSIQQAAELKCRVLYHEELFDKQFIERLLSYYEKIVGFLLNDKDQIIGDIDILSTLEKEQLLNEFNNTKADYPEEKTIHQLFEEQVERTPDNIALVFENQTLSYRELNEKSNQVARLLREHGVKSDEIVAIIVDRSFEMIVGLLAILKAGGAYLPIDIEYPEERISYILSDSQTKIILTSTEISQNISDDYLKIILDDESIYSGDNSNLLNVNKSSDLIYVIYTSGTTGNPKGVTLEHRNVVNFIHGINSKISFTSDDSILALTTISFDIFVLESILPLVCGSKVVIGTAQDGLNGELVADLISSNQVNKLQLTPSRMQLLMASSDFVSSLTQIQTIMLGGESLPSAILVELRSTTKAKIFNMYGPTETTVWSAIRDLSDVEKIDIGNGISNTTLYILSDNKLVPIGVPGELCIGGDGLARGYLGREDLTKEKFIWWEPETGKVYDFESKPSSAIRIYRTGDLAKWLSDGNIEFLGRIDHQVKIRGFRIELGEIESALLKITDIKETVVIAKDDTNNQKYLVAYFVAERNLELSTLRSELSKTLPDYMIPSYFVQLESLPLNQNGKIDRKALPEPEVQIKEYLAPRNDIESQLVTIWSEVLNLPEDKISIDANFFELGGHSLKATIMMSKIHKAFDVKVTLAEIFKNTTIMQLGAVVKSSVKDLYKTITPAEIKPYYHASAQQQRLYILQTLESDNTVYNMPGTIYLGKEVDKNQLEQTFRSLINRHESFRTSFAMVDDELVQYIHETVDFELDYIEINEELEYNQYIKSYAKPFDLSQAPLLRATLMKHNEEFTLLYDMHHIISDGTSHNVLSSDFMVLYEGKELSPLCLQYKDYAEWQHSDEVKSLVLEQEKYWLSLFADELPVLNLPYDYPRPAVQSFDGHNMSFVLNRELTAKLKDLCKETNSTLFMTLLSICNIWLSKLSGNEAIVVGTPIAARNHVDLEAIVGMFVNTLAFRNKPIGKKNFKDFLTEVRESTLQAYENQEYQFEELVDKVLFDRDLSRNPLFDVMLVLQNMTDYQGVISDEMDDLILNGKYGATKFDIHIFTFEIGDKLQFSFDYCTKLFKEHTVERLILNFKKLISIVVESPNILIDCIEILSESEKKQLLYEFNDTKFNYPKDKSIFQLFEKQVEFTPDNIALVIENSSMTYRELNEKSNQVAMLLRDSGVRSNCIVAILLERSFEMLIGIMAILKSGGAYLPIDPEFPFQRIENILADSSTKLVITTKSCLKILSAQYEALFSSTCVENIICIDNIQDSDFDYENCKLQTYKLSSIMEKSSDIIKSISLDKLINNHFAFDGKFFEAKIIKKMSDNIKSFILRFNFKENTFVGVLLSNPIYKIAVLNALKEIDVQYRLINKSEIYAISEYQILISETLFLNTVDKLYLKSGYLNSVIFIDDYQVETDDKEADYKNLWEYVASESTEEINDFGWKSCYTNEPFSKNEMLEFIDNVKFKVCNYLNKHSRVMEVGCGHGSIMFELYDHVDFYLGVDISVNAVQKCYNRIIRNGYKNIDVQALSASNINSVKSSNFNLIILSSVVQYFPNTLYLEKVIQKLINLLSDEGGYILLSDLLSLEMQDDFLLSLKEYKFQNPTAKVKTNWNDELFVDVQFFNRLMQKYSCIVDVVPSKKIGRIENELTRYRYDLILKINKNKISVNDKFLNYNIKQYYTISDINKGSENICGIDIVGDTNFNSIELGCLYHKNSFACYSVDNLNLVNSLNDLAYVIYTSGSTGNPKGTMIEHHSVINRLFWMQKKYPITAQDKILFKTPFVFDVSVWEIFWWSFVGAKLCILKNKSERDPSDIVHAICAYKINTMHFVPSMLSVFLDYVSEHKKENEIASLKQVFASGEALQKAHEYKFKKLCYETNNTNLINLYGPTEATVDVSYYDCLHNDNFSTIPIGKPIDNIGLYIINKSFNLQPIGVPGELCIGGAGLARGYLGREDLTKEKFIWWESATGKVYDVETKSSTAIRIYRTGDLAKWLPDGNIEFLGRIDYQVKIRGFRIELGEIESALLKITGIKESVVIAKDDANSQKYLVAYFVLDKNMDLSYIRSELSKSLPDYMIPSYFVPLESLPLNQNGKIDRKALPDPEVQVKEYLAPRNEIEAKLVTIWSEVLNLPEEKISIDANFFELGGHSLKATIMMSKIHKAFDVKVALADIFKNTTIMQLGEVVKNSVKDLYKTITPAEIKPYYHTSSQQKRLYILQTLESNNTVYNLPGTIYLGKEVDKNQLEQTFKSLINRHDSFRTSFAMVDDELVQYIHESVDFELGYIEINEGLEFNQFIKNFANPFDLSQAPLLRATLVKHNEEFTLLYDMHHIISDGTSHNVLSSDFMALYEGKELSPLRLQYKDYAEWQHSDEVKSMVFEQEKYWLSLFADEVPVLNLPYDYPRQSVQSFAGHNMSFVLNRDLTAKLKDLCKETNSTLFMTLLSICNIWLSKLSGNEDIIVGTPIAARRHADLEAIVGMFVNTLAFRNKPVSNKNFKDFLFEVRESTLHAYENQEYQFENLVDKVTIGRDLSRNPLFDVMFSMPNYVENDLITVEYNDDIKGGEYSISKFDLTIDVSELNSYLKIDIEYSCKLFKEETIKEFIMYFKYIVTQVVNATDIEIGNICVSKTENYLICNQYTDCYGDF